MATNEKVLQGKCTNSLLRVCVPVCYTICMCEHACHSLQVGLILSFHLYTGFRDQTYQACNPQGASALSSEPSPQFSRFPCQEIHLYATDDHSIAGATHRLRAMLCGSNCLISQKWKLRPREGWWLAVVKLPTDG